MAEKRAEVFLKDGKRVKFRYDTERSEFANGVAHLYNVETNRMVAFGLNNQNIVSMSYEIE